MQSNPNNYNRQLFYFVCNLTSQFMQLQLQCMHIENLAAARMLHNHAVYVLHYTIGVHNCCVEFMKQLPLALMYVKPAALAESCTS